MLRLQSEKGIDNEICYVEIYGRYDMDCLLDWRGMKEEKAFTMCVSTQAIILEFQTQHDH